MKRIQITDEDVADTPEGRARLRQRLDMAYGNIYLLLGEIEALKTQISSARSAGANGAGGAAGGALSARDRLLLDQLAIGSTASAAPAQNALEPKVSTLPPPATSIDGQVVILSTDGQRYRFDGPTLTWVATSTSPHNLLSGTHPDTIAAAPVLGDLLYASGASWTKLAGQIAAAKRWLRQTGTGAASAAPAWDQPASTDLSDAANLALLSASNIFSSLTPITFGNGAGMGGATYQFLLQAEEITLSTIAVVTNSSANLLSGLALLLPVLTNVTQTISGGGTTKYRVGDPTTNDRFTGDNTNLTAGNGQMAMNHWKGGVTTDAAGPTQAGSAKVRITTDAAPTQGKIRVVTLALVGVPPTS